jgi:hypothetical protein
MLASHSQECSLSQADPFNSVPPTQVPLDYGYWQDVLASGTTATGTIYFKVEKNSEMYTDLAETELYVNAMVVDAENEDVELEDSNLVGPE